MKVILSIALTLLTVSGALNWALMTGHIGAARFEYVKLFESPKSLTAYEPQNVSNN